MEFKCFREWTASATNYSTSFFNISARGCHWVLQSQAAFTVRIVPPHVGVGILIAHWIRFGVQVCWNTLRTPFLWMTPSGIQLLRAILHVGRRRIKNVNTATPHLNPTHSTIIQRNIHIHPQRKKSYQECGCIPTPHTFLGADSTACQKQVATFVLYPVCSRPVLVHDMLMFGD